MIRLTCPSCSRNLKVKDELADKRGVCPHCKQRLIVPAATPTNLFDAATTPKTTRGGSERPRWLIPLAAGGGLLTLIVLLLVFMLRHGGEPSNSDPSPSEVAYSAPSEEQASTDFIGSKLLAPDDQEQPNQEREKAITNSIASDQSPKKPSAQPPERDKAIPNSILPLPVPADKPRPPRTPEREKAITNSIGMKLVRVEPGVFLMGSPKNEAERGAGEVQHEVEITRPFYVGVYEVTQEQYERVMDVDKKPSYFSSTGDGKDKVQGMDTRQFPVELVSWKDAVKFCRLLSELPQEKANERLYRLPTEAEWEYVCRGGPFIKKPSPPFSFGDSLSSTQANFNGNFPYGGAAKGAYLSRRTTKVGSYPPNPLGVYDLHGNVWEWCADWYDAEYAGRKDPQGPENGERRVLRGSSGDGDGAGCRAACRESSAPGGPGFNYGFRVVLVAGARD